MTLCVCDWSEGSSAIGLSALNLLNFSERIESRQIYPHVSCNTLHFLHDICDCPLSFTSLLLIFHSLCIQVIPSLFVTLSVFVLLSVPSFLSFPWSCLPLCFSCVCSLYVLMLSWLVLPKVFLLLDSFII